MAAILEALVPYVTQMISDMTKQEVNMLLGIPAEMKKLGQNMENIKVFLAEAERQRITNKLVQGWVNKLKGVMYDATDVLELGHLKAEERRESTDGTLVEKMPGCFQPFLLCVRNPVFAHKIGSRIKELNQRLEDIHEEAAKFNFLNSNLSSSSEPKRTHQEAYYSISQKTTPEFIPSDIVGEQINRDTKLLVHELVTDHENYDLKLVSIVGMGGMGKTTLARKIFKDPTIDEQFKMKIWLSITQQFSEVELLRTAIKQAGGDHGGDENNTLLTQTLTKTLSAGKFLLVLDDMWGVKAWESILSVPVTNASEKQPGSRVLITTRIGNLAPQMHHFMYQHHVSPLAGDDAWSLLKTQLRLPPNQEVKIDHLKDLGMKIIKNCGGLPLAIKIMGGLLCIKPKTELEWQNVLNHRAWSLDGLPEELDQRLYLSYDDLCPELKQCFLYWSLFPKGTYIVRESVIRMWTSEGFVQTGDASSSPEDVAREYFQELVMRNLIEPHDSIHTHLCSMHDVVRCFVDFMSREESLVLDGEQSARVGSIGLVRRISVGSTESVPEWALLQKQESLRTLIINGRIKFKPGDSLTNFSSLRVLEIRNADCDMLIHDSLCQLRHLRFLGLYETNVSKLPDDIHRLKLLQHIVLKNCWSLEKLPSSIIELVHLRTFSIDGLFKNDVLIPKRFGRLTNLRLLDGFPAHRDTDGGWCSLDELAPLSKLSQLTLLGLENLSPSFAEKAAISSKGHLTFLVLSCCSSFLSSVSRDKTEHQKQTIKDIFEKLCPPSCIEHLQIQGYFGRQLPSWMLASATVTFKSLRILAIMDLPHCTQLPDGLCLLTSLERLQITNAPAVRSVGPEFQASIPLALAGGVTAMSSIALPNLKYLFLLDLCEWEDWKWEEPDQEVTSHATAMPALEELMLKKCKLRCLPPGLASSKRHALRELSLWELTNLTHLENFPSVLELDVFDCPKLKRIRGLSRLLKIRIQDCPNLELLEDVPILDSLVLKDKTMETLPGYLQGVNPRHLKLSCSREVYKSISLGGYEWDKISHVRTSIIYYFDPDQESWIQAPIMKSDPSAGGVRLQLETGSKE